MFFAVFSHEQLLQLCLLPVPSLYALRRVSGMRLRLDTGMCFLPVLAKAPVCIWRIYRLAGAAFISYISPEDIAQISSCSWHVWEDPADHQTGGAMLLGAHRAAQRSLSAARGFALRLVWSCACLWMAKDGKMSASLLVPHVLHRLGTAGGSSVELGLNCPFKISLRCAWRSS